MAKTKYTAFLADIRGKNNGTVFSKNKGGSYVRTKVTPVNGQSTKQTQVRNRFTTNSQAWRGLTDAQRNSWNSAVDNFKGTDIFGDVKTPSGINLYGKLNNNLAEISVGAISTPPLPSSVPAVTSVSAVADQSAQSVTITFAPTPVPADTAYVLKATPQVSPGVKFVKSKYVTIAFFDAAATSPQVVSAAYIAQFGALITGTKIGFSLHSVNKLTGQSGLPLQTLITVQA